MEPARRPSSPRAASTLPTTASRDSGDHVSQAQTTTLRHPRRVRSSIFRWSRATLAANFPCQNSVLVLGVVAWRQPGCRCQKQPWTKTATCRRAKTMSGVPGRPRPCNRYLRPRAHRAFLTISSGSVWRLRTCRIRSEASIVSDRRTRRDGACRERRASRGSPTEGVRRPPRALRWRYDSATSPRRRRSGTYPGSPEGGRLHAA